MADPLPGFIGTGEAAAPRMTAGHDMEGGTAGRRRACWVGAHPRGIVGLRDGSFGLGRTCYAAFSHGEAQAPSSRRKDAPGDGPSGERRWPGMPACGLHVAMGEWSAGERVRMRPNARLASGRTGGACR